MSYLLDTNVISETVRKKPNEKVMAFLESLPDDHIYLSVLSLGEIRKGVEKLEDTLRKQKLNLWLETELIDYFENRILPIDEKTSDRWGRLLHAAGRPVAVTDSLIAATALEHDLRVITRNEADFNLPNLEIINPWTL